MQIKYSIQIATFISIPMVACTNGGGGTLASTGNDSVSTSASGDDADNAGTSSSSSDTATGDTTTAAESGTDVSTGDDPEPEAFDCNDAPALAVSYSTLSGPRGYHGLAIKPDGKMIGNDGSLLVQSDYDGPLEIFTPGVGTAEQMGWVTDSDLALIAEQGILKIKQDGTFDILTPLTGQSGYGLVIGPDGMIYTTQDTYEETANTLIVSSYVVRTDPSTGASETILENSFSSDFDEPSDEIANEFTFHAMSFSLDEQKLYLGTIGRGVLYSVDLDTNMNPASELMVLSDSIGIENSMGPGPSDGDTVSFNGWHDGVEIDICGNIYVTDYYSSQLFRVDPLGTTTIFWDPAKEDPDDNPDEEFEAKFYAHGLLWGTGKHDWKSNALYVSQSYNNNSVGEVVIGVPSRNFTGEVLNKVIRR